VQNHQQILTDFVYLYHHIFLSICALLLSTAIGIFRGYSIPKEEKTARRKSFVFSSAAGALIFLSLISWGGAYAFINKNVTEIPKNTNAIQVIDAEKYGDSLVAPIDIEFSIEDTVTMLKKKGISIEQIKWSKDGGKNFIEGSNEKRQSFSFTSRGLKDVTTSILLSNGEEQTFHRIFEIDEATFAVPPKIHAKKKTTFDARGLTTGGKLYKWDFDGDGIYDDSSSRGLMSHVFKKPGTFEVKLRIELAQKASKTFTRSVRVYSESEDSIVAEISSEQEFSGQAPFTIALSGKESYTEDGDIVKYNWTLGKLKKKKKGQNIEYTFNTPGEQKVLLFIENDFGEKASTEITINVTKGNSPPKAILSSIPQSKKSIIKGNTPLVIQFSGEKSTDSDENITEYNWKIENKNGEKEEFSGSNIQYDFREKGEYTVTLTVRDEKGEESTQKVLVIMTEPSVVAVAQITPEFGTAPLIVDFNASESSCKAELCSVTGFSWDFKDGTPLKRSGSQISHRFEKAGNYPVKLTVYTNTGDSNTKTLFVNVSEPEFTACFTSSRSQGIAPVKISFDPKCSKGEVIEYKWDFGDGYISRAKRPSHTFEKAGKYNITLHIIDKNEKVSQSTKNIIISEEE